MTTDPNRSWRRAFVITLLVVAFTMGLVLALWGVSAGLVIARVAGTACIAAGAFLLLAPNRHLFTKEAGVPSDVQVPAEKMLRTQLRFSGATSILMGVAILIPDLRIRAAFMLSAAVVSIAGILRRRKSVVKTPA